MYTSPKKSYEIITDSASGFIKSLFRYHKPDSCNFHIWSYGHTMTFCIALTEAQGQLKEKSKQTKEIKYPEKLNLQILQLIQLAQTDTAISGHNVSRPS